MPKAPRTLVLANREPFSGRVDKAGRPQLTVGGLVSALAPLMSSRPGGWIAARAESSGGTGRVDVPLSDTGKRTYPVHFVGVPDKTYARYYNGVSNRALWPLFHSFIDRANFERPDWDAYVDVNQRFADATLKVARKGDVIWVHDYHLMLVPGMLRAARPSLHIGFFLHIPFPGVEVFRVFPRDHELLTGLLGADLVGFHTPRYAVDFAVAAKRLLGAKVTRDFSRVRHEDRQVHVRHFPIGIDSAGFAGDAEKRATAAGKLRDRMGREIVVLGVDRLDYTKGILDRLVAFELFLERTAEARGRVVLVQVCVPSRIRVEAYKGMKRGIEEAVGRINGRFGDAAWTPIRYLYRSLSRKDLITHYRAADIALITPRRDGMNLVAKEYVAASTDNNGVLILSELAGAANQLTDALLVNPYDIDGIADALASAIRMSPEERVRRMKALRRNVLRQDGHWWCESFLSALGDAVADRGKPAAPRRAAARRARRK